MAQPWVVLLVGMVVANVVITVALYYWTGDEGSSGPSDADESAQPSASTVASADARGIDDGVVCRQCGTRNAPGYRFCRNCVGELPGPSVGYTGGGGPDAPGMR